MQNLVVEEEGPESSLWVRMELIISMKEEQ